jgi:hypothetical protein
MAGTGPAPNPNSRRQRKLKASGDTVSLVPLSGLAVQPKLDKRPDGTKWHPAALELWNAIWSSPMSQEFDVSDVHGLMRLIELSHMFWSLDNIKDARTKILLAGEIRLASQAYGLSPLDRRRLKWTIAGEEEATNRSRNRRSAAIKPADDPRLQDI